MQQGRHACLPPSVILDWPLSSLLSVSVSLCVSVSFSVCLCLSFSFSFHLWSEIIVTDRQTKKQIMKLEEELPEWRMALEIKSIPGG